MKFEKYLLNEKSWESKPKGWTEDSIKKYASTLAKTVGIKPDEKGFFDAWVSKMEKHLGKGVQGFCASVKDKYIGNTKWREGPKKLEAPK